MNIRRLGLMKTNIKSIIGLTIIGLVCSTAVTIVYNFVGGIK